MKKFWTILLILIPVCNFGQDRMITGTVFEDRNGNNRQDVGEPGIPQVVVSDQVNTTLSDKKGNFSLKTHNDFPYIFISQLSGYTGKFFYKKTPTLNFPLKKGKELSEFTFIHASDTHIDSLNLPRMARFREMADSVGASFILVSGDLIRDALRVDEKTAGAYYEMYVEEIAKFSMPVYSGVGNHEIFGIERDKSLVSSEHPLYGKKMYRHYLGPNYYSFNYGGIHFVSLDGVDYQNLYYFGGVDTVQLNWLKKDLNHLPEQMPIITFNHIPFMSPGFSFQKFDSHIFYGPQLLKQGDKLQHRHIVYNYPEVKKIIGNRPFPLALSGHYHAAQEAFFTNSETVFAQTSAITRPDTFKFNGFTVRSGFTVYRVKDAEIISSQFVPLNFP